MYRLRLKIFISAAIFSLLSIDCEHCDDEDYRKEEKENQIIKQTDTLTFKNTG